MKRIPVWMLAEQRPESVYDVDDSSGCWIWNKARQSAGYGHFYLSGRTVLAHRWFYEKAYGPIPEGLVLDHKCRTPACVNPFHIEAVTPALNAQRRLGAIPDGVVEAIRREYLNGNISTRALASKYKVAISAAWCIAMGRTRSDVKARHADHQLYRVVGERSHNAKLSPEQVIQIREMVRGNTSHTKVAAKFGVARQTVDDIVHGRLWRHLA